MNIIIFLVIFINILIIFKLIKFHRFLTCPHLTIFLFGYVFYMLLYPLLYITNLVPHVYSDSDMLYSVLVSTIGVLAFYLSYSLILVPKREIKFNRDINRGLRTLASNYKNAFVLVFIIIVIQFAFSKYINYGIIISTLMLFGMSSKNIKSNYFYLFIALLVIVIFVTLSSTGRRDLVSSLIIWSVVAANLNRSRHL